jgi:hypothetical protein
VAERREIPVNVQSVPKRKLRRFGWYAATALVVVAAAPIVMSASGGAVPPHEKTPGDDPVTWSAPAAAEALLAVAPSQDNLEFVAFSVPCRFLDTRISGGALAADTSRDLPVLDASLPVGLGPCGVPARAKAVSLSLSTIGGTPTGTGYARLGPGGVAPTATVLQFLAGQGISVTTNSPLSASSQVRLASFLSGSGYVGDLLGYWQQPVQGMITSAGTLSSGTGITQIQKSASFLGDYTITFDRTINPGCSVVVTGDSSGTRAFAYPVSSNQWFIDMRAYNSTAEADGAFSLVAQC